MGVHLPGNATQGCEIRQKFRANRCVTRGTGPSGGLPVCLAFVRRDLQYGNG